MPKEYFLQKRLAVWRQVMYALLLGDTCRQWWQLRLITRTSGFFMMWAHLSMPTIAGACSAWRQETPCAPGAWSPSHLLRMGLGEYLYPL